MKLAASAAAALLCLSGACLAQTAAAPVSPIPADAPVVLHLGDLGAQVLAWATAVFVPVIGTFLTKWIVALAKKAGVDASQAMSDRLDAIVQNGLHGALQAAGADLTGKLDVDVKNKALAAAVAYAQANGADTLKNLGAPDPNDPAVVAALQARAAKALNSIAPAQA